MKNISEDTFDCFETHYKKERKKCQKCYHYNLCIAENEFYNKQIGKQVYLVNELNGDNTIVRFACFDPFTALEKQETLAKKYGLEYDTKLDLNNDFPIILVNSAVSFVIEKIALTIESVYLTEALINLLNYQKECDKNK